jgi:SAM-dependent methyltransferase
MLKALLLRAKQIYREEGLATLISRAKGFGIKFVKNGFSIPRYQSNKRADTQKRWTMLQKHIDDEDQNLLDLGCADGQLTTNFHDIGLFCVGVDRAEQMLALARSGQQYADGIGFIKYDITPDSIRKLPDFDVVLLLTVYHHWVNAYGIDYAEEMLINLSQHCDKLFFEPPGRAIHNDVQKSKNETVEEYYTDYLTEVFPARVNIHHIGTTNYAGGERSDPLYLIT